VEGSCEHGIEPLGSIKFWEVLEGLHNWGFLKKGSAGRSHVRFLMRSFDFSIDLVLPAALRPLGRLSL
jgi:hypothetical protein